MEWGVEDPGIHNGPPGVPDRSPNGTGRDGDCDVRWMAEADTSFQLSDRGWKKWRTHFGPPECREPRVMTGTAAKKRCTVIENENDV